MTLVSEELKIHLDLSDIRTKTLHLNEGRLSVHLMKSSVPHEKYKKARANVKDKLVRTWATCR